ncbi:CFI-box-CTERM domain-containing protein [Moritella sp. F3]|uniref:CFI-box-CTERM domain-containing protein n=1 Tax=Moritella sp. F3 TaxID=2718882 RepID=UPI0018E19896|nr:CFI-box-CTERM domain-containing protein [Moritella sp. F3]GIC77599.1 hypothetical protein FMO001_23260 [Moritella sp. F1]GIC82012.1 hypothetical protein FMO003_22930 [Moritella sp. F3]
MKNNKYVNASDCGKVAYCPQSYALSKKHKVTDKYILKRQKHGNQGHAELTNTALAMSKDSRCFIATYAFGEDSAITCDLRLFRDEHLKPHLMGRVFISIYYALSPLLISLCKHSVRFKFLSILLVRSVHKYACKRLGGRH